MARSGQISSRNRQSTRSIDAADYQRVARPIAAMPKEFTAGSRTGNHAHERGQLLYAVSGLMRVVTPAATYAMPPLRAVWMPAGSEHDLWAISDLSMRTLYIDTRVIADLPTEARVLSVSDLLRSLILAMMDEPVDYDESGRGGQIAALLLTELKAAKIDAPGLALPRDRRVARVAADLLARLDDDATLDLWGERVGASARTLARGFLAETGLTFADWRAQARIAEGLGRLALGDPVAVAAARVGYRSPAAFTAAVRRFLGAPPSRL